MLVIISCASRTTYTINLKKKNAKAVSLDFSFVNFYLFYLYGDNGSGILNVFETNRHLNTMQNNWVVQIIRHILAIG